MISPVLLRHVTAVFLSTQLFYAVCDLATSQVSLFGTGKVTQYFVHFWDRCVFIPKCMVVIILPVWKQCAIQYFTVFSSKWPPSVFLTNSHYLWTSSHGEASAHALSSPPLLLSYISIPSLTRTPFQRLSVSRYALMLSDPSVFFFCLILLLFLLPL